MEVKVLSCGWGARIRGLRAADLSDDGFLTLRKALRQHALVVLQGQHLGKEEQIAFTSRFGRLERLVTAEGGMDASGRELAWLTNRARAGEAAVRIQGRAQLAAGNQLWHADSTFKPVLSKFAFLAAHIVPREGGQTEFADMRAAYDALAPEDLHLVQGLCAVHDYAWSQRASGAPRRCRAAPAGDKAPRPPASGDRAPLSLSGGISDRLSGWTRPRPAPYCAASLSTAPARASSIATTGPRATLSSGITVAPCTEHVRGREIRCGRWRGRRLRAMAPTRGLSNDLNRLSADRPFM